MPAGSFGQIGSIEVLPSASSLSSAIVLVFCVMSHSDWRVLEVGDSRRTKNEVSLVLFEKRVVRLVVGETPDAARQANRAFRRGPMPPFGYWAKKRSGKRVSQRPLPPRDPGVDDAIKLGGYRYDYGRHWTDQEVWEMVPEAPTSESDSSKVVWVR